jgi:hypothetical protein
MKSMEVDQLQIEKSVEGDVERILERKGRI